MRDNRFDRQELLFGSAGQSALGRLRIAIVGVGGLGSHVAQQLVYLGISAFELIDGDRVTVTNLNRLIGAIDGDAAASALKVDVAERLISAVATNPEVRKLGLTFVSPEGFQMIREADYVFGCVDNDASRAILTELCLAYQRPYFDLATDVDPQGRTFGGRIIFANGRACAFCRDLMDQAEIRAAFQSEGQRREDERIYGVRMSALSNVGPSVVSINGVVASLAVTEFMVEATRLRPAALYLEYRGSSGVVTRDMSETGTACYYCSTVRGLGARADVERYLRQGFGTRIGSASLPGAT